MFKVVVNISAKTGNAIKSTFLKNGKLKSKFSDNRLNFSSFVVHVKEK